jgi:hypothetical protein
LLYLWYSYILCLPKLQYNQWNPYTTWIPIFLFIFLRHLTPFLREHPSVKAYSFLSWMGKRTLETYILQFHLWLADDANAIIVYISSYPVWNFCISSMIYLYFSHRIFECTNVISEGLFTKSATSLQIGWKFGLFCIGFFALQHLNQFLFTIG